MMKEYSTVRSALIIFLLFLIPCLSTAKDSAGITNAIPSTTNTNTRYYSSPTTLAPAISNEKYGGLPDCNDEKGRTNINLDYCPDINGNYASASFKDLSPTYCPDACKATRTIQGRGWARTSVSAVCPKGYSSVAQFNMQPEYNYYSSLTTISPIIGLASYNFYLQNGILCSPSGTVETFTDVCNAAPKYSLGQTLDSFPTSVNDGTVVKISYVRRGCYRTASNCDNSSGEVPCSALTVYFRYTYNADIIGCQVLGMTPTGYMVPATQVCARVSTTWRSAN